VKRWLLALISATLLVLLALALVDPQRMLSPGSLMRGHAELEQDCFACHAPWRGATAQRCVRCHALPDIGLRTTRGVPIPHRLLKVSFHQELIEQDCIACHGDHQGLTRPSRRPFSHALLRATVRERCENCHGAPADGLHRDLAATCGRCHKSEQWKPATFDHQLLAKAAQQRCEGCHKAPADNVHRDLAATCGRCHQPEHWKPATFDHQLLAKAAQQRCEGCHKPPADIVHRQVRGNCAQCHSSVRWKPATLDHDKLFVLDADHNVPCATCHTGGDYSRYTCYGCHAHRPDPVRARHLEEGIQNFENCVRCHRSARGEPEGQ
jgi:hypothetical protein